MRKKSLNHFHGSVNKDNDLKSVKGVDYLHALNMRNAYNSELGDMIADKGNVLIENT